MAAEVGAPLTLNTLPASHIQQDYWKVANHTHFKQECGVASAGPPLTGEQCTFLPGPIQVVP